MTETGDQFDGFGGLHANRYGAMLYLAVRVDKPDTTIVVFNVDRLGWDNESAGPAIHRESGFRVHTGHEDSLRVRHIYLGMHRTRLFLHVYGKARHGPGTSG